MHKAKVAELSGELQADIFIRFAHYFAFLDHNLYLEVVCCCFFSSIILFILPLVFNDTLSQTPQSTPLQIVHKMIKETKKEKKKYFYL